jgi:hypothetical protein
MFPLHISKINGIRDSNPGQQKTDQGLITNYLFNQLTQPAQVNRLMLALKNVT